MGHGPTFPMGFLKQHQQTLKLDPIKCIVPINIDLFSLSCKTSSKPLLLGCRLQKRSVVKTEKDSFRLGPIENLNHDY